MATNFKPCSVDGCNGDTYAKGLCRNHYRRFRRHGDPLGGAAAKGVPLAWFKDVAIPHHGDECLIWPFAKDALGYAVVHFEGKVTKVHRLVCDQIHGPPPTHEHEVRHSCGKGHLGCVNHRHLRWGTHAENLEDMVLHGTACFVRGETNKKAKLTENCVREIRRRLSNGDGPTVIANDFGVSPRTVTCIKSGRNWGWLQ